MRKTFSEYCKIYFTNIKLFLNPIWIRTSVLLHMANATFFEYHFLSIIMKGGGIFILEKKAKRKMKRKKENKDPHIGDFHISWKFLDSEYKLQVSIHDILTETIFGANNVHPNFMANPIVNMSTYILNDFAYPN